MKIFVIIKFNRVLFLSKLIQLHKKKSGQIGKAFLSGWQDSNLRPPRPKRGAITGLRYTPKVILYLRRDRDSNPGNGYPLTISNLLHYHSGTSPINFIKELNFWFANVLYGLESCKHFSFYFTKIKRP